MKDFNNLELIIKKLKRNMLNTIHRAQTGHVGACCSSTELMGVLYFSDILRIDDKNPKNPDRDYVLVRGHMGPLRYNIFSLLGWMKEEEMLHYREYGSRLCGHEDMNITPGVDLTPSGSLGMLLSYAVGARFSFKKRGMKNRVFCFLGDGEEQEGNVSEAARHATNLNLENLIVIIDKNKKQLSTQTSKTDAGSDIEHIWRGYGWQTIHLRNGHDIKKVYNAYLKAIKEAAKHPVCIIADTVKGNGINGAAENYNGFHVYHHTTEDNVKNRIPIEDAIDVLSEEIEDMNIKIPKKLIRKASKHLGVATEEKEPRLIIPSIVSEGNSYAFLDEYLNKISRTNLRNNFYVLTADYPPRNLVYSSGGFQIPNIQYCNVGIREQHLLSMVHGISTTEKDSHILVLCGDAFLYRFGDQLNVLAQSKDNVTIYSVQAGLSGAKNGSSHQSSGQPGMVLTMPGVDVYEPSSKLDWFHVMNKSFNDEGVKYVRTHQNTVPYDFGNFKPRSHYRIDNNEDMDALIITNGMIVREAVHASNELFDDLKMRVGILNVLDMRHPQGIEELVPENIPLFFLYNGHPAVLSYPICRELLYKGRRNGVIESGFTLGKTGNITDLMKHFGLDKNGIYTLIKENI